MHPTPLLKTVRADLDWSRMRFPGESDLRREIDGLPNLRSALNAWTDPRRLPALFPVNYLAGGFVATPSCAPALYRVAVFLKRILRLEASIEIHLFPTQQWLIEVLPEMRVKVGEEAHRQRSVLRLAISAAVAERLWARESLFAIGRKLGRHLFQQLPLCADPSVGSDEQSRAVLLTRGLWRFQELSCDRIGLLCCQDSKVALRAILKSVTGLSGNLLQSDLSAMLKDRLAEDDAMVSPWDNDFNVLRMAALERFAESELYKSSLDSKGVPLPAAAVPAKDAAPSAMPVAVPSASTRSEREPEILSFPMPGPLAAPIGMEADPPPLDLEQEVNPSARPPVTESAAPDTWSTFTPDEARRTFALHAALWLISQRDGVGDAEREALADQFGPDFLDEVKTVYEEKGPEVFEETARSLATRVASRELDDRLSLLRDLVHIAMSAGRLEANENAWLKEVGTLIDITPSEASLITAEFTDPEYADYEFERGQDVEVLLDGEWMPGTVLDVDSTGDLRIEFSRDHDVLHLNPTADLIRPTIAKRA